MILLHSSRKILQLHLRSKPHQVIKAQKLHSFNNLQSFKRKIYQNKEQASIRMKEVLLDNNYL